MIVEKTAGELKVGDTLVAKFGNPPRRFKIIDIRPGLGGLSFPYLTMTVVGEESVIKSPVEHDTSLDSVRAKYLVDDPETTKKTELADDSGTVGDSITSMSW